MKKLKEWKVFDDPNLNSNIQDSRFMQMHHSSDDDQTISLHAQQGHLEMVKTLLANDKISGEDRVNEGLYGHRCEIKEERVESSSQRKTDKRVTIHMNFRDFKVSENRPPKLILLPDSLEELLKIAGKNYTPIYLLKALIVFTGQKCLHVIRLSSLKYS